MTLPAKPAHYARYYDEPANLTDADGTRHWITRSANFAVVVTQAQAGAVLERAEQPDEYMLLLPEQVGARIEADGQTVDSEGDSLTILPPGRSRVIVATPGWVYRVFSNRAADIIAAAGNAAQYADGAPHVAPFAAWPEPTAGWKLRHYKLADYVRTENSMRMFRSSNLMINIFVPQTKPRDMRNMTPHSHTDFEQGSLSLAGSYVHHLRFPWTPDMNTWREDDHGEVNSPSLIVIPPTVIHTTQAVGSDRTRLVDIFAPPRTDFSLKPGLVRNADEYPLPASLAAQQAATGAIV
jgi:hypothetical protein